MIEKNQDTAHIVLRLRKTDVERFAAVAAACRMTRTAFIRKSISRNLAFTRTHELPLLDASPELREARST